MKGNNDVCARHTKERKGKNKKVDEQEREAFLPLKCCACAKAFYSDGLLRVSLHRSCDTKRTLLSLFYLRGFLLLRLSFIQLKAGERTDVRVWPSASLGSPWEREWRRLPFRAACAPALSAFSSFLSCSSVYSLFSSGAHIIGWSARASTHAE